MCAEDGGASVAMVQQGEFLWGILLESRHAVGFDTATSTAGRGIPTKENTD